MVTCEKVNWDASTNGKKLSPIPFSYLSLQIPWRNFYRNGWKRGSFKKLRINYKNSIDFMLKKMFCRFGNSNAHLEVKNTVKYVTGEWFEHTTWRWGVRMFWTKKLTQIFRNFILFTILPMTLILPFFLSLNSVLGDFYCIIFVLESIFIIPIKIRK